MVAGIVAGVAIIAVAVTAFALNNGSAQVATQGKNAGAHPGAGGTFPELEGARKDIVPRTLSHARPLRLWIGGDSLAGSFGPALGDLLAPTGVVRTQIDYKVSSGLWGNDIRNWPKRATEQMTSFDPEAVVFIIGTNDAPIVNKVDANHDGVADWIPEYRAKVDRMLDIFVGTHHRTVFWLGAPTLENPTMDSAAAKLDAVFRQEAAKRARDVQYVDTFKLFSGTDGRYSKTIVDERGDTITARIGDGVHFTAAGAQYLARAVNAALELRWRISSDADPSQPIGWTLASGSGETVPGFSSPPRSRYHSYVTTTTQYGAVDSTTASTVAPATSTTGTPPTTVPPTTTPPTTTGGPTTTSGG